jgi:CRISPR system Cascade subunit CasC
MISTQAIEQSVDFFGAADDFQCFEPGSEGISGSAANDTICCYRYCSLDLDSLARNLSDLSHEPGGGVDTISLRQSYEWFISRSLQPAVFSGIVPQLGPSVPDCILVETRQFPVPVSYAGAFTDPVFYGADNSLESAAKRMLSHADRMAKNYQLSATDRLLFAPAVDNLSAEGCKRVGDVTELLDCLSKVVCHV